MGVQPEGIEGAIGKPPRRLRRGESPCKIVCFACDSDYIICTSSIYTIVPPAMDKSICRRQMCSSTVTPATQ